MTFQERNDQGPPDVPTATAAHAAVERAQRLNHIWKATEAIVYHGIEERELRHLVTAMMDQVTLADLLSALALGAEWQTKRYLNQTDLAAAWTTVAGMFEAISKLTLPEER